MKCPYQDIGCWYIDDVSHECEASASYLCEHENGKNKQNSRKQSATEDEEE
jgi:hypothetical protein